MVRASVPKIISFSSSTYNNIDEFDFGIDILDLKTRQSIGRPVNNRTCQGGVSLRFANDSFCIEKALMHC